jgi:hypothetical protein
MWEPSEFVVLPLSLSVLFTYSSLLHTGDDGAAFRHAFLPPSLPSCPPSSFCGAPGCGFVGAGRKGVREHVEEVHVQGGREGGGGKRTYIA